MAFPDPAFPPKEKFLHAAEDIASRDTSDAIDLVYSTFNAVNRAMPLDSTLAIKFTSWISEAYQ
ncbi:hypothetical protein NKH82_33440 [Mesorhizobium sp. M0915]|uniref:hypothetical protein n=1 Tax=Mesorhizobium sp. M0915 TaxID=2957027 RepID=UPI00333A6F3F